MIAQTGDNKNNREQSEPMPDEGMKTRINDIPFKMFRPLLISMALFGLLHHSGKERRFTLITKIYSTVVLILVWVMFIKCFTMYGAEGFEPTLFFRIAMHCWTLQCAVAVTTTYMACRSPNKLTEFLTRWTKLLKANRGQALDEANIKTYVRKANLTFYLFFILSWLGILVIWVAMGHNFFASNFLDYILRPMNPNHPHALLLRCVLYVMYVFMCAAWVFTLCLFYTMGFVIYEEFRIFHEDLEKAVRPNGDVIGIGTYRRRHQEICLLVEKADDVLSGFSAVSIAVCTLTEMLILYSLLWYMEFLNGAVFLMAVILWFLSNLVYLVIIAVGGGYLNHMAHAPLKTIHNIELKTISTEVSLQMNMFIAKLTGESIGLTAIGMFVIDKPTIFTICGFFLTYFIVLVQFQKPADQLNVLANCTCCIGQ